MKRSIGAVAALVLLMVMMTTSFGFAGTLKLDDSYPRDGDKGMQVENSGVKLYFNQKMIAKNNIEENLESFKLTDAKGKALPIRVLYSPKEEGLVLVLVDNQTLLSDSTYKLSISKDVMAASGDTLAKHQSITFNTVDTSSAMKANMAMMGIMVVGVVFMSSRAAKKQMEKDKEEAGVEDKVNPYKVAKETGKSVEEVVALDQKDKEKQRRKQAKKLAKEAEEWSDEDEDAVLNDNKLVKGPRPIAAGGSAYITGRKAAAEERARKQAQAGTTRPKSKGKKKK